MSFVTWIIIALIAALIIWLFLRWFNRSVSVDVYTPSDGSRQSAKLKPYLRREVVEAKVKSLFPQHAPAEILQLLDNDIPSFFGLERVQLDILKLSDGDTAKLHYYIELAKSQRDFMKVINLAERPESSKRDLHDKDLFWGEHKKEIERDFRQYLKWLKKKR
jgi:hypothetical protein